MAGEGSSAAEAPGDDDVLWDTFSLRYPLKYDFAFAIESEDFCDRTIRLEIVPGEFRGAFELPRNRCYPYVLESEIGVDESVAHLYHGGLMMGEQKADLPPHQEIGMPSLSPTMTEVNITKWVKNEGDILSSGDILCEVEMDKAILMVKCLEAGYLANIVKGDDAKLIKVGEIICVTVEKEGDVEKFKDYKPSYSDLNGPLSSVKGTDPDACMQKADVEECLGGIAESSCTRLLIKRVRDVHINSAILAANSNVFLKMFSNGLKESTEKLVPFKIAESEEEIIRDLINFLYTGKLRTDESGLLLDILTVADRFEVFPLMRHIVQLLSKRPMTVESALMFLDYDYSYSESWADDIDYLTSLSSQFLVSTYKDLTRIPEEFWEMPLAGIESIYGSSDIQVDSEDDVYDFMVKWARLQYPNPEERDAVYSSKLLPLVRFCYISHLKLEKISLDIANCLHPEETLKIINVALIGCKPTSGQVPQREYKRKPIRKLAAFDAPCPQSIVYFDLTRDDCSRLFPDGQVFSHAFSFAGQTLDLMACCQENPGTNIHTLGFWVRMQGNEDGAALTVELEFASRERASGRFVPRFQLDGAILNSGTMLGGSDLFEPWPLFLEDENLFINGVVHLKVDLSVVALLDL